MTVSENILYVLMDINKNQDMIIFCLSLCCGAICGLAFLFGIK